MSLAIWQSKYFSYISINAKSKKMKKNILLIAISFLSFNSLKAQIIYNEDFETFTIGNVSTSSDGQTPGQNGWFVVSSLTQQNSAMSFENLFQIENEPVKGKVITMAPHPYPFTIGSTSIRKDISAAITNRTSGNDVVKLEIDFYTAQQATNPLSSFIDFGLSKIYNINTADSKVIAGFNYDSNTGELKGTHYDETSSVIYQFNLGDNNQPLIVPFNTWVHFVVYADYINNKVVYEIPSLNIFVERDFFIDVPYPTNISNYVPESFSAITYLSEQTNATLPTYKFDNLKVTALDQVLSTNEVLSNQFNLYPNPAIDLVTITNQENITVEQIRIYDLTGKLMDTQNFENKAEIQLTVGNLTSGTYLLHLQTNEGSAVKKLIKN